MSSNAWRSDDRVLLVTMGSPLRRFFFRFLPDLFFPPSADAIGDCVSARLGDFRWANVYRPWDQVGGRLKLSRHGSAERSTGQWLRILTAHPNYWADHTVFMRAQDAIQVMRQCPSWTSEVSRSGYSTISPQEDHSDPLAHWALGYLLPAAALLLATPLAFGWASSESKTLWDTTIAEEKEYLARSGVTADATVIHRVETYYTFEPETKWEIDPYTRMQRVTTESKPKINYIDKFVFRFKTQTGVEITKKMDFLRGENDRFFDPERLRNAVASEGEVLGKTSIWNSADSMGRQLKHVPLVYAVDRLVDVDAMAILLPDYPPGSLTLVHIADWIRIVLFSLFAALAALVILAGGYACFLYFLGARKSALPLF